MSTPIRLLLADDHPVVRLGLAAIIQAQADMSVVAQASTGREAVEMYSRFAPDVTVMDLRMPEMSGVEAIRQILAANPHARVVVLTMYHGDEDIHQSLNAGAMGYVMKGMAHQTLVDAIRTVHAGLKFIPPPVARSLETRTPNSNLSPREREVLLQIAQGKNNKEIAASLGITEGTVKCHINVILSRLGVSDRTQAVLAAVQRGFVDIA